MGTMEPDYWAKHVIGVRVEQSPDLNRLKIAGDQNNPDQALEDCSAVSADGSVSVYFRNIEERLIECIRGADMVVGCDVSVRTRQVRR